jgi:hypothetical protein
VAEILIHYAENGNPKQGTTLCGIPVRATMGVICTSPKQASYLTCPECIRLLRERDKDPSPPES